MGSRNLLNGLIEGINGNVNLKGTVSLSSASNITYGTETLSSLLTSITNSNITFSSNLTTQVVQFGTPYIEEDPTLLVIPFSNNISYDLPYQATISVDALKESVPPSPLVEYKLDTLFDTSGNNRTLSLGAGAAIVADSEKGKCLELKSASGYVQTTAYLPHVNPTGKDTVVAPNGTGLTISFDIKIEQFALGNYCVVGIGRNIRNTNWDQYGGSGTPAAQGITLNYHSNGRGLYLMYTDGSGLFIGHYNYEMTTLGQWYHIDMVIPAADATTKSPLLYINGVAPKFMSSGYEANTGSLTFYQSGGASLTSVVFTALFENIVKIANLRIWLKELSPDQLRVLNNDKQILTLVPQVHSTGANAIKCRFMDRTSRFVNIEDYFDKLALSCMFKKNGFIATSGNIPTIHLDYHPLYFNSGKSVIPAIKNVSSPGDYQAIGISPLNPTKIVTSIPTFGSMYQMTSEINNYQSTYGYENTVARFPLPDDMTTSNLSLSYVFKNSKTEPVLPQFDTKLALGWSKELDTKINEKKIYIIKTCSGNKHTLFLTNIGTVYACGDNTYGQLLTGDTTFRNYPVPCVWSSTSLVIDAIDIAAGGNHSMFLRRDGFVYGGGLNTSGQLGLGVANATNVLSPQFSWLVRDVTYLTGITAIAAGESHSVFLHLNGKVYTCGLNSSGQLGDASTTNKSIPAFVTLGRSGATVHLTNVRSIAAGNANTLFLTNDKIVYACGRNTYGELADGNFNTNVTVPTQVRFNSTRQGNTYVKYLFANNNDSSGRGKTLAYTGISPYLYTEPVTNIPFINVGGTTTIPVENGGTFQFKIDGRIWGIDGSNNMVLGAGRALTFRIVNVTGIYTDANGPYVGIQDVSTGLYLRHDNFVLHLNTFAANNHDYAWKISSAPDGGLYIYNAFNVSGTTGSFIGYNGTNVLIVTPASKLSIQTYSMLSATIGDTTNSGGLIVDSTSNGTGMVISFDMKLKAGASYTNWNQYIFAVGNAISVPQTGSSSAVTAGITMRFDSATTICFLLTYNGSHAQFQYITYPFSETKWDRIDFVINKNLVNGTIAYTAYINGVVNIKDTWSLVGSAVTSLDIGNNAGNGLNQVQFYGSTNAPKIANFNIWRTDDINVTGSYLNNVKSISSGTYHTAYSTTSGDAYVCGYNIDGRLGVGSAYEKSVTPLQSTITNVSSVSAGGSHTLFLKNDGSVYSCGGNTNGQLGNTSNGLTPALVTLLQSTKMITTGLNHSTLLNNDDSLYSFGQNDMGQIGDGTNGTNRTAPVQLRSLVALYLDLNNQTNVTITKVTGGDLQTLFLGTVNTTPPLIKVWGCGYNVNYRLGMGNATSPITYPLEINTLNYKEITDLGTGDVASVFLSYKNNVSTVYTCGANDSNGRQMDGTSTEKNVPIPTKISFFDDKQITKVVYGWACILLLTATGTVYGGGINNLGQLADGGTSTAYTPIQCKESASVFLTNVVDIATGRFSMFVKSDGSVWGCGANDYGNLGNNTTSASATNYPQRVQVDTGGFLNNIVKVSNGDYHALFLTTDGKVYACGLQNGGPLGNGESSGKATRATLILFDVVISDIGAMGGYSIFVSDVAKKVYMCGGNDTGRLGLGNLTSVFVPTVVPSLTGMSISNIFKSLRGPQHTGLVTTSGKVALWGLNTSGQLGLGDLVNRLYPPQSIPFETYVEPTTSINGLHIEVFDKLNIRVTKVATCGSHTLFLGTTQSGEKKVYACGLNTYGQLGVNDETDKLYPVEITALNGMQITDIVGCHTWSIFISTTTNRVYGCGRNYHGNLGLGNNTTDDGKNPMTPVEIFALRGKNIIKASGGDHHTMFLSSDTTVWCCGYNNEGPLGINNIIQQNLPVRVLSVGTTPLSGVIDVSCGLRHTLFLLNDGTVRACGMNDVGQLGNGNTTYNTGYPASPVLNGTAFTTSVTPLKNIVKIAAGWNFSIFLADNGNVLVCGEEANGSLGTGVPTGSLAGGAIVNPTSSYFQITDIQAGADHVFLLSKTTKRLYAWGRNDFGQLGLGDTTDRLRITEVSSFNNIDIENLGAIHSMSYHGALVTTSGSVYLWGENANGRLGGIDDTGSDVNKLYPELRTVTEYPTMDKLSVIKASFGYAHTILLAKVNGVGATRVFASGRNAYGQLGDGTTTQRNYPVEIKYLSDKNITDVVCGDENNIFISYNADPTLTKIYGCGRNDFGQLGNGNFTNVSTPVDLTYIIKGKNIVKIISGSHQTYFISSDKTAWACGHNNNTQLSIGNTTANQNYPVQMLSIGTTRFEGIIDINSGTQNTFIIKENASGSGKGTVWVVGRNDYAQLSLNNTTNNATGYPLQVQKQQIKQPVFTSPSNITVSTDWPTNADWNITQTSFYSSTEGEAWRGGWWTADNTFDAQENGNQSMTIRYPSAVSLVTFETFMYINSYANIFSIQYSDNGDNFTIAQNYTHVQTVNGDVSFIVPLSGAHRWWRINVTKAGGNYPFRRIAMLNFKFYTTSSTAGGLYLDNITAVSAGLVHTMFLSDEGNGVKYIYTCGHQASGRLGDNVNAATNVLRATQIPVAGMSQALQNTITTIQAYRDHSLLYSSSTNKIFMFGVNSNGQLGDGTGTSRIVPTELPLYNSLTFTLMKYQLNASHTGVIFDDGRISMWGINDEGQFGANDVGNRASPEIRTLLVAKTAPTTTTMVVRVNNYDFNIPNVPYVLNASHRVDVVLTNNTLCAYLDGIKSTNTVTLQYPLDITTNKNIRVYQREGKTSQQFGQIKVWNRELGAADLIRASKQLTY